MEIVTIHVNKRRWQRPLTTAQPPKTILKLRPSGWRLTDGWCNGRPWGLRASVARHRRLDEEVTKNIGSMSPLVRWASHGQWKDGGWAPQTVAASQAQKVAPIGWP